MLPDRQAVGPLVLLHCSPAGLYELSLETEKVAAKWQMKFGFNPLPPPWFVASQ